MSEVIPRGGLNDHAYGVAGLNDLNDLMITILQLCEHFGGEKASLHGVARGFQWWLPAFDKTEFRVLLCSRKARDKAAEEMERLGLTPFYLGYGKFDLRNLTSLLKLLDAEKIDIIHAHGYGACTWGRIAGLIKGIPVIVHERCNTLVVPWYQRPIEWILGKTTKLALAVSESSRQFCIEKRYMKADVVKVLYHGILMKDIPRIDEQWKQHSRKEHGTKAGEKVIGIVGRLESHKGHIDAFKALVRLLEKDVSACMWVVGDGAYADVLREWVAENGLEKKVQFLGFRRDALGVIQCFDVHLFPSHMEGTPNTLYEAMAVGNAIVASTADGQGEILTDGKDALMFEPGDDEKMAGLLGRILGDKDLENRLRDASRQLSGTFDGMNAIHKMEEYYRGLMKRDG